MGRKLEEGAEEVARELAERVRALSQEAQAV